MDLTLEHGIRCGHPRIVCGALHLAVHGKVTLSQIYCRVIVDLFFSTYQSQALRSPLNIFTTRLGFISTPILTAMTCWIVMVAFTEAVEKSTLHCICA